MPTTKTAFGAGFAALLLCAPGLTAPGGADAPAAVRPRPAATPAVATEPYRWRSVRIVAGGFVNGLIFNPAAKGVLYARTDMGGAYRWDPAGKAWVPLTDWAGQTDWNLRGIESIGVDPTDPDRVYIAAGTYTNSWAGSGAILRSADRGRTWKRTDLPLKMGGNEDGRSAGERLAVDPNRNGVLYFGSRNDGLWRSADYGATWAQVKAFPVTGRTNGVGVVFVVFDRRSGAAGRPTPTIYAGVSGGDAGLYRSTDAGATWAPVPGQPPATLLLPHQAALDPDGALYVTYGDHPGPNGMTGGAVWKLDTRAGAWADVSPLPPGGFGYAGLSLDARHPGTVMVSTMDRWNPGDDVLRTTDGGRSWKGLAARATLDPSLSPYLKWGKPAPRFGWWLGALAIDPFDPGHVLYGTGATIWESRDVTGADAGRPTHWAVGAKGLEETAVIDLASPPSGAHLLSALGDIGGFRHDDLDVSPPAGMFADPMFSNTDGIDFAEGRPAFVVRVGRADRGVRRGAYSEDGGTTWKPFGSEPAGSRGGGAVAVSADGAAILWAPPGAAPSVSTDRGATWAACAGLPNGARPVADRVDPRVFYAFSPADGALYASTDGGAHFAARAAAGLPTGDRGARLRAVPGAAGDLWLTAGGGLYHTADGGARFARLDTADRVAALGFGKAAPGKRYVALYAIGTVAGVEGFFRSDDAGAHWVRINDDQHQYGLVGPIIGDPRVYGRVYLGTNGRGILYADPAAPPRR